VAITEDDPDTKADHDDDHDSSKVCIGRRYYFIT
jgi:hypothetical protein